MNGTIRKAGWTLGSVALIALGGACSHQKPAKAPPPQAQTTPTFESQAPGATQQPGLGTTGEMGAQPTQPGMQPGMQQPGMEAQPGMQGQPMQQPGMQQPGMQPEMQGQPGMQGQMQPGMQGQQPGMGGPGGVETQPGMTGQENIPGTPGAGGAAQPVDLTQLCSQVTQSSNIRVENVQNGVALVLTPKTSSNLDNVRESAHQLEQVASQQPGMQAGATQGTCGIVDLAQQPGNQMQVAEGPKNVRLLITTTNTANVKTLRKDAHTFVSQNK